MAVMVKLVIDMDVATYQAMHGDLLPVARDHGLILHSGREVDGGIGVVDFWQSDEAWQSFLDGPMKEGLTGAGIPVPDEIEVVPVLIAGG
jgi:hypothetical protein